MRFFISFAHASSGLQSSFLCSPLYSKTNFNLNLFKGKEMKKSDNENKYKETVTRENPPYYKIDHKLAVAIWTALFKEEYIYLEKDLSRTMIEQGLQEIESEDMFLVLSFWKEYIEENDLATFIPDGRLH